MQDDINEIKKCITIDYLDDVILIYHTTNSLEFALKVGKLASHIARAPSILARSINFDEAYKLAEEKKFILDDNSKLEITHIINNGLNK